MRALNIAIFIFILSLSFSAVKEAYGLPHTGPLWSVKDNQLVDVGTIEQDNSFTGYNIFKAMAKGIQSLLNVIAGAALLGTTLQSLMPFSLPGTITTGLNVLGSTSAVLAMVQFVRGIGTRVME